MRLDLGLRSHQLLQPADTVALTLNEPDGQNVSWTLDVWAALDVNARTYVGTVQTPGAAVGTQRSRLIATASCPGARGWMVEATGPGATNGDGSPKAAASADLRISPCSDKQGELLQPGVYRVKGRVLTVGGALASQRVDQTGPVYFRGAYGSNESGSDAWIFFFNAAAVGGGFLGLQPFMGQAIFVPAATTFNFALDYGDDLFFNTGVTWGISSTNNTYTSSGGNFRVTTRCEW